MDEATLRRFADLIVTFGANVQPGQIVSVGCEPGKEYMSRAIADSAYRHGAKFVEVTWFDPHIKRSRIEHADEDTLDFVPDWYGKRLLALGEAKGSRIGLSGPSAPGLMEGLDPARLGKDRLPMLKEVGKVVGDRSTNWSISPCPSPAWAALVHPDLEPADALAKLESEILHVCRLDTDDPVAAWNERRQTLVATAQKLTDAGFDALHFEGPGTDLTVGLFRSSRWLSASFATADGLPHMPNLPSEEVFTTPDPDRVDGHVAATLPLVLTDGTIVRDLRVTFEGGRATSVEASEGGETMQTVTATDEGACRLGEVALVDGDGRIGKLGTVFFDTLLDENAASHIAFGHAYEFALEAAADRERANTSKIHIDFMIGSPEVRVTGITRSGERVPVLHQGAWQF